MLWTYYVYVVCLCYFTSDVVLETVGLLVVYHALLALTLWAHCMSVSTPPRVPPEAFHYSEAQWSKLNTEFLWIERREEMESLRMRLGIRTIQASMGRGTHVPVRKLFQMCDIYIQRVTERESADVPDPDVMCVCVSV